MFVPFYYIPNEADGYVARKESQTVLQNNLLLSDLDSLSITQGLQRDKPLALVAV
jgi:hypothetical protein